MTSLIITFAPVVLIFFLVPLCYLPNYDFIGKKAKFYRLFFKISGSIILICGIVSYIQLFTPPTYSMALTLRDKLESIATLIYSLMPYLLLFHIITILKNHFQERRHLGYILITMNGVINLLLIINGILWVSNSI